MNPIVPIVVGSVVVLGGAALIASSKKSGTSGGTSGGGNGPGYCPNPPCEPPLQSSPWQKTSILARGDHLRMSVRTGDVARIAKSLGMNVDAQTLAFMLATIPAVKNVINAANVQTWGPGDVLPNDWPPDDTDKPGKPASDYHADFIYRGVLDVPTAAFPIIPATWWHLTGQAQGGGGGGGGGQAQTVDVPPIILPGQTVMLRPGDIANIHLGPELGGNTWSIAYDDPTIAVFDQRTTDALGVVLVLHGGRAGATSVRASQVTKAGKVLATLVFPINVAAGNTPGIASGTSNQGGGTPGVIQ